MGEENRKTEESPMNGKNGMNRQDMGQTETISPENQEPPMQKPPGQQSAGFAGAGMEEHQRPPQKNRKKLVAGIAVAVMLAALIGGIALYRYMTGADPERSQDAYLQMQQAVIDTKADPYGNTVDFEALWEINTDVIGWLKVPGTNVDYPVLCSVEKADDYYLNTTIDHKAGLPGSIYIEKYNMVDFSDPVTVVYGHNLKNKTMFSQLHKYEDEAFFQENPYFYIYQPGRTFKYHIFAAVAFDDRYILGDYGSFRDDAEFSRYVSDLKAQMTGHINGNVSVQPGSHVVSLSTCIAGHPNQRWIVSGLLVDAVEKGQ